VHSTLKGGGFGVGVVTDAALQAMREKYPHVRADENMVSSATRCNHYFVFFCF
jgi:hypothetical protein